MPNYAQVSNGKVAVICPSQNVMVEIDTLDDRLLGTTYDPVTGEFSGHKILLAVDKAEITADGVDTATITATVYNWDDTVATDYAMDITFEVDGVQQVVTPVDGVATITFVSSEVGEYLITTANDDMITNGSISIESIEAVV